MARRDRVRWRIDQALAGELVVPPATIEQFAGASTWRRASQLESTEFTREELAGTWALRLVAPSPHGDLLGDFEEGTAR